MAVRGDNSFLSRGISQNEIDRRMKFIFNDIERAEEYRR